MACNCGGVATSASYSLVGPDGSTKATYLTRTEAVAALSAAGSGYRVVAKK